MKTQKDGWNLKFTLCGSMVLSSQRWIDYTAFVDVAMLYKIFDEVTYGQHVWMIIYQMSRS